MDIILFNITFIVFITLKIIVTYKENKKNELKIINTNTSKIVDNVNLKIDNQEKNIKHNNHYNFCKDNDYMKEKVKILKKEYKKRF